MDFLGKGAKQIGGPKTSSTWFRGECQILVANLPIVDLVLVASTATDNGLVINN